MTRGERLYRNKRKVRQRLRWLKRYGEYDLNVPEERLKRWCRDGLPMGNCGNPHCPHCSIVKWAYRYRRRKKRHNAKERIQLIRENVNRELDYYKDYNMDVEEYAEVVEDMVDLVGGYSEKNVHEGVG